MPISSHNNCKTPTSARRTCSPTSSFCYWKNSDHLWHHGAELWMDGNYFEAMGVFERSIQSFRWEEVQADKGFISDASELKCLWSSPLSCSCCECGDDNDEHSKNLREILAKRCCFLGMCFSDAQEVEKARIFLCKGLCCDSFLTVAIIELMLSFEEEGNMKGSRAVAQWAIDGAAVSEKTKRTSPWRNKYQRPGFLFLMPTYSNTSYFPPSQHPAWCRELSSHSETLKQDFLKLWNNSNESSTSMRPLLPGHPWPRVGGDHRSGGRTDGRVVERGDWREMVLFSGEGEALDSASIRSRTLIRNLAPEAVSLCEAGAGEILFSVLAPNTRVAPHCASTNLRLTAHLALVVPATSTKKKCSIRVEESWYNWKEGECIVFDDSYEHEVINDTDECRVVLLLRFWHPSIPSALRQTAIQSILSQRDLSERLRYVPPLARTTGLLKCPMAADPWKEI